MHDIPEDLLEKAAQGDRRAFEDMYKLICGFVYGTSLRITRNNADAQEVTQDVFLKIYHNLSTFAVGTSFKAWVYRITVNTAINAYHKRKREAMKQDDFDIAMTKEAAPLRMEDTLDKEYHEKKLSAILEMLNPDQRACILLREIEGLDYKEIAEALKININTVRSRLKRAREVLIRYGRKEVMPHEV